MQVIDLDSLDGKRVVTCREIAVKAFQPCFNHMTSRSHVRGGAEARDIGSIALSAAVNLGYISPTLSILVTDDFLYSIIHS